MFMKKPRLLFVTSMKGLPAAGRGALALAKAGFEVAAVSPEGSVVRKVKAVERHYEYRRFLAAGPVLNAILDWNPDFLACADDPATALLHAIHRQIVSGALRCDRPADVCAVIERSMGDPNSFDVARRKSELIPLALSMGVLCPHTTVVSDPIQLMRALDASRYPIVLKKDETWAGSGVRVATDRAQALAAYAELTIPKNWWDVFRLTVDQKSTQALMGRVRFRQRAVSLQEYVPGRPANCALLCWKGEILAGVTVEVIEVIYPNGPATVVRAIEHPGIRSASERLVRRLGTSGFCGFDFIIDPDDRAWLIEMNPRTTPIFHIPFANGADLPAVLLGQLTGTTPRERTAAISESTVALFPDELSRSRDSQYLSTGYHDVPWEEPDFVRACLAVKRLQVPERVPGVVPDQAAQAAPLDARDIVLNRLRELELR